MRCKNCNELFRDDAAVCPYCGTSSPYGSIVVADNVTFWIQALTWAPVIVTYHGAGKTSMLRLIRGLKSLFIVSELFTAAIMPCLSVILKMSDESSKFSAESLRLAGLAFGSAAFVLIAMTVVNFILNITAGYAIENKTWSKGNSISIKITVIMWGIIAAALSVCTFVFMRDFMGMAFFAIAMLCLQIVIMNLCKNAKSKIEGYRKYTKDMNGK